MLKILMVTALSLQGYFRALHCSRRLPFSAPRNYHDGKKSKIPARLSRLTYCEARASSTGAFSGDLPHPLNRRDLTR